MMDFTPYFKRVTKIGLGKAIRLDVGSGFEPDRLGGQAQGPAPTMLEWLKVPLLAYYF